MDWVSTHLVVMLMKQKVGELREGSKFLRLFVDMGHLGSESFFVYNG